MKTIFDSLINTLNQIEVKGKDNLDKLLGCIQTLEQLKGMIKVQTVEAEEVPSSENNDNQGKNL